MSIVPFQHVERRHRRPLDQAQIVRAALGLLDEVGFDELTMRRLAEKLGVQAASLYRYVRNKDELLILLADEISSEIPLPDGTGSWRDQLARMADNYRRGLLRHRDAARVLASTAPFGPRRLRHIEAFLKVLRSAGLGPREAAHVGYHWNNFVTEFVADETRFETFASDRGSTRRKVFADARKHFKSLPRDQFPTIVELADPLTDDDRDALFHSGVELFLRGIEIKAKHR